MACAFETDLPEDFCFVNKSRASGLRQPRHSRRQKYSGYFAALFSFKLSQSFGFNLTSVLQFQGPGPCPIKKNPA